MNIGIVTTWFERGASYVSKAYRDVLAKKNRVFIYARGGEENSKGDPGWDRPYVTYGKTYRPLGRKYQPFTSYKKEYVDMLCFEAWLRENEIDIVIFNEEQSTTLPMRTKKLGYTIGAYIDYYKRDTVHEFSIYDFLLCNTERHYSVFRKFPRTCFIPWGTDIKIFRPMHRGQISARDDGYVRFFHSAGYGGVNNRKGTDLLVRAFQQVKGKCILIIHSQVPAERYGMDICKLIENDHRIEFIKKTITAPGLYHLGDVFVYPSRLEGIGLCVPEALSCGLPVITTDNAPMNEFVIDGYNGLLIKVKDERIREDGYYWPEKIACIDDLAKKMQQYTDDRTMLKNHKFNSRKYAEEKLNWEKNTLGLEEELKKILEETKKVHSYPIFFDKVQWKTEEKYVSLLCSIQYLKEKLLAFLSVPGKLAQ